MNPASVLSSLSSKKQPFSPPLPPDGSRTDPTTLKTNKSLQLVDEFAAHGAQKIRGIAPFCGTRAVCESFGLCKNSSNSQHFYSLKTFLSYMHSILDLPSGLEPPTTSCEGTVLQ